MSGRRNQSDANRAQAQHSCCTRVRGEAVRMDGPARISAPAADGLAHCRAEDERGYSITIEEGPPPAMTHGTGEPTATRTPVTGVIVKTEIVPASPLAT